MRKKSLDLRQRKISRLKRNIKKINKQRNQSVKSRVTNNRMNNLKRILKKNQIQTKIAKSNKQHTRNNKSKPTRSNKPLKKNSFYCANISPKTVHVSPNARPLSLKLLKIVSSVWIPAIPCCL